MCVPKLPTLGVGDAWHCKAFVDEEFGMCLCSLYQRPNLMNKEKGPDSFEDKESVVERGHKLPVLSLSRHV